MVEQFQFFLSSFLVAAVITLIALRNGFFQLPDQTRTPAPTLNHMLAAFGLFLTIELLIVPALAGSYLLYWKGVRHLSSVEQGWFNDIAIIASSLGIILYSLGLPAARRKALYGAPVFKNMLAGAATWVLSYPWVIVSANFVALILLFFGPLPHADQVAVKQLKISSQDPLLFTCTIVAIVALVPLAEELLFRGFLQGSLVPYLGRVRAILLSSIIFAGFHFSTSQGWDNFELILSLFILSCYLGLIYEKRGSLWAPVGLHMAFNSLSVALILWQKGALA